MLIRRHHLGAPRSLLDRSSLSWRKRGDDLTSIEVPKDLGPEGATSGAAPKSEEPQGRDQINEDR